MLAGDWKPQCLRHRIPSVLKEALPHENLLLDIKQSACEVKHFLSVTVWHEPRGLFLRISGFPDSFSNAPAASSSESTFKYGKQKVTTIDCLIDQIPFKDSKSHSTIRFIRASDDSFFNVTVPFLNPLIKESDPSEAILPEGIHMKSSPRNNSRREILRLRELRIDEIHPRCVKK
jgi:hypothetical protein